MANHQRLDNVTHQNVKVNTAHHPNMLDTDSYARVVLSELAFAQSEYPLFLRKNGETGQFEIIAMLGLNEQENLFVDAAGWHAQYIPLSIQLRPFLIGFQDTDNSHPTVHIDMDSPRISETQGEQIFLAQGGQSPYLQKINSILQALHEGLPQTDTFANLLQQESLIEPVSLNIELNNGEKLSVGSLYTIHEENVAQLDKEALGRLHEHGFLSATYMMIASLQNVTKLIERKNQSDVSATVTQQ